jgi:hypothetical protein
VEVFIFSTCGDTRVLYIYVRVYNYCTGGCVRFRKEKTRWSSSRVNVLITRRWRAQYFIQFQYTSSHCFSYIDSLNSHRAYDYDACGPVRLWQGLIIQRDWLIMYPAPTYAPSIKRCEVLWVTYRSIPLDCSPTLSLIFKFFKLRFLENRYLFSSS